MRSSASTESAPVEILLDEWGVAHIYAASDTDVYFAQGFNAARQRLFQIDLWRRRGLGLLSEVFGPECLEQDRATRLFLYRGDMDVEWRGSAATGSITTWSRRSPVPGPWPVMARASRTSAGGVSRSAP
jgi:acyl-homoserine lactone acylase PvdQ